MADSKIMDKKTIQIKIWNAVEDYTLAQIVSATPVQIATAASLTSEEIELAKKWQKLIKFRLINAKKDQLYDTVKEDMVKPDLQALITDIVDTHGIVRSVAKNNLMRMLEDLMENL